MVIESGYSRDIKNSPAANRLAVGAGLRCSFAGAGNRPGVVKSVFTYEFWLVRHKYGGDVPERVKTYSVRSHFDKHRHVAYASPGVSRGHFLRSVPPLGTSIKANPSRGGDAKPWVSPAGEIARLPKGLSCLCSQSVPATGATPSEATEIVHFQGRARLVLDLSVNEGAN